VVRKVTFEGLLSGAPMHVNVHAPGSGNPPPVACANLNEARQPCPTGSSGPYLPPHRVPTGSEWR
jgi:hypothetical protein